ncbi:MAG: hypothetical protein NXI04_09380 [Planctomycetaceae bacterium]|nr:hypothetical protein [Planctomycetaceae bacterium]
MSGGRQNENAKSGRADWRGRTRSGRSVKHRWQKRSARQRGATRPWRTMTRSVVSVALLLGMTLGFVWLMRFRPRQTPVVAIMATQYEAPFQPNGWAFEDLQALRHLDADTLTLFDATEGIDSREQFLAELDRLSRAAGRSVRNDEPFIVYLSLHVDTDPSGRPALIPPGASPLDSTTWVPFADVVEQVVSSRGSESCPVMLVIDCHRHVANWHRAEVTNRFVEAVRSELQAEPVKNLTVMTSCSTGEQSLGLGSRHQSSFGYYFVEGLRGGADRHPTGNGDHYVSLRELTAFVTQNVSGYARSVYGLGQTVQLISGDLSPGDDYIVSWVSTELPHPTVKPLTDGPAADLESLWSRYETLAAEQPQIALPVAWAGIQARLLRLEKLVQSGAACRTEAAIESSQLSLKMSHLEAELAAATREDRSDSVRLATVAAASAATAGELARAMQQIPADSDRALSPTFQFASLLSQQKGSACWKFSGLVREAITTRALAESTWNDIPAGRLPWCVSQLNLADASRRQAEDALLTGRNARDGFRTAADAYRLAADRSDRTREAVHALATSLSELVWWTRWKAASAESSSEQLLELMESTHRLAAGLSDSRSQLASLAVLPFTTPTAQVQQQLRSHHDELNAEYAILLRDMTASTRDIQRARALLELPLLPAADPVSGTTGAAQRQQLRSRLDEAIAARASNTDLTEGDGRGQETGRSPEEEALVQNLLAVQNSSAERDTDTGRLMAQAGTLQFRVELQQIYDSCRSALNGSQPEISEYRQQLINSEFRLRLIAPLFVPSGFVNTIAARQRLDRDVQTLDLCQRTLDDFYGPAVAGGEPYFAETTTRLLTSFRGQQGESVALQRELIDMNRLLNRRRRLLTEGLNVRTSSVLLLGSTQLDAVDVHVRSNGPLERFGMSPLAGSLYFADADNTVLSNAEPLPLIPQTGAMAADLTGRLRLTEAGILKASSEVFAVANLRGNMIREPVLVSRAGGAESSMQMPAVRAATVDVQGQAAAGQSIVVIFDCSQSMATAVRAEVAGSEQTRFQVGLRALSHLLHGQAAKATSRLGLMFFGHRVGWNPQNPQQMLINDGYLHSVPGDLRPWDDVEMALPVGRFDAGTLESVAPLLASLRPWGETPLYLALTDAFSALESEDVRRGRRVVVLTDGVNRQTNPSAARKRTLQDVLGALPEGVRVDIVGYQISRAEAGQAESEFQTIARASGGQFQTASDLTELLSSLSGLMESDEFVLRRASGELVSSAPGRDVTVSVDAGAEQVSLNMGEATAKFLLHGGEALKWKLSDDGRRLEVPRWTTGTPRWSELTETGTGRDSGLQCATQAVRVKDQAAQLVVSVQDPRGGLPARPTSLHVRLTPLDEMGRSVGESYDCDAFGWLPGTPVPAVGITAGNWPADAKQAEVRLFVRPQRAPPVDQLALSQLKPLPDAQPLVKTPAGINGVMVYVIADRQLARLTVVEQHGAGSPGVDSLVIQLATPKPVAFVRRQRTDRDNRVVSTVFEFQPSDGIPLANGTLEFILREDVEQDALHTLTPVIVPVSSDNGLLIPTE